METKEKRSDESKFEEKCCGTFRCEGQGVSEMMGQCCASEGEAGDCRSMMSKCMKGCRWFPLIPVILGIFLFVLGYCLDPRVTRVLWMAGATLAVLMGLFCLLMISKMKRVCCGPE
jgi:hypothetical protein